MSASEDGLDFRALEKELQAALAADEKYQRENAAKFRAVHQKVASYEEFRDIVLASHLRPLERKDKTGGPRAAPWNSHATLAGPSQEPTLELDQEGACWPETSAEFQRDWRRRLRSGPERYRALLRLGGARLGRLFRADVGCGLLGEILVALADHAGPPDRPAVLDVLSGLARAGRFRLNLSLLSRPERESCRRLFRRLRAEIPPEDTPGRDEQGLLRELLHLYQVD
ncbi:LOW QUALITY PROTEIN: coiled-coil domain-containing protein 103 [Tachyglossus aculeatus]|uniref:LOW QUALITY PROTEIN: coiled-coil domain-containing protein 103 n=1 Tax=Tachyglossus aculeatus TaxID=9261 RepID=UPI0018F2F0D7|nr:LOW QUALITY PROTEIN: coiled-coil domain-containing protein 103 [Tachyglossus aculeatus]